MSSAEMILAATDWSENARRAVQRAAYISAQHSAQGMLLHVADHGWPLRIIRATTGEKVRNSAGRLLTLAKTIHEQTGVAFDTQVQVGNAASSIARVARIKGASLITIGRWTDTALIRWVDTPFEESLALRLLNQANTPVLIAKSDPTRPYRRVLVALDCSEHSGNCIEYAKWLAPDAEIVVAHAIDDTREKRDRHVANDEKLRELCIKRHEAALDRIHAILEKSNISPHRVVTAVERAYAPKFILDMELKFSADLLVIGCEVKSRFRRLFFGGITSQVLARSRCDVLIVSPHAKPLKNVVEKM